MAKKKRHKKGRVDTLKASAPPKSLRGLTEQSNTGLRLSDGRVYDDVQDAFRWPYAAQTFKQMSYDSSVAAAQNVIKNMIRKIRYEVVVDEVVPTSEQKEQIQYITECMGDMDHSWSEFMNEALSILTYGFSLHEKVFKYRKGLLHKTPSKFSDGRLGWKRLPIRSQATVYRWNYDNFNRDIVSVEQRLRNTQRSSQNSGGKSLDTTQEIPYKKLLHFRHDTTLDNPEGTSPLKSCYVAWKYKVTLEELEAIGVSKDMRGVLKIKLPAEYMSDDATDDQKAMVRWAEDTINNYHNNEAIGFVQPSFVDPTTKTDRFDMELMGVQGNGGRSYDTDKMINRYENKIMMAYAADVLKLGQDASGSFALAGSKTNLMAVGIEAILKELLDVINRDLVIQTLLLNGWDLGKGVSIPRITFEDLDERDLDELGKFIQRTSSVGALEITEPLSEALAKTARLPMPNRDKPINPELVTGGNSDAGRGMATPGVGNSTNASSTDTSSNNSENAS